MVTTLYRLDSTFPFLLLLLRFSLVLVQLDFVSNILNIAIYRKEPRGAEKLAQASCSSPRRIYDLVLKALICLGELIAYG